MSFNVKIMYDEQLVRCYLWDITMMTGLLCVCILYEWTALWSWYVVYTQLLLPTCVLFDIITHFQVTFSQFDTNTFGDLWWPDWRSKRTVWIMNSTFLVIHHCWLWIRIFYWLLKMRWTLWINTTIVIWKMNWIIYLIFCFHFISLSKKVIAENVDENMKYQSNNWFF